MIRTLELRLQRCALILATTLVLASVTTAAAQDTDDGKWHFIITPYLWLPDINGTLQYTDPAGSGGTLSAEAKPNNYLQSLDFAAMFAAEARKDRFLVFSDYMYLHFGGHDAVVKSVTGPLGIVQVPVNVGGAASVIANVWTVAGGYNLVHAPALSLDLFGGARLLNLRSSVSWDFAGPIGVFAKSGNASQNTNDWDGVVGVKGEVRFGESKWFMPYYADIGTGSSNWTWQGLLGVGYRLGWGDVLLTVRTLSYDFNNDRLDLRFTGPAIGASFKF
jgi:hypothetical protein